MLWAAVRATWGVTGGKYYYEVTVEENIAVELPETEEHPHALRYSFAVCKMLATSGQASMYSVVRAINLQRVASHLLHMQHCMCGLF